LGNPIKILEINTERTWRGGERQTFFALKGFRDLDQQVELLAMDGFPLNEKSQKLGITCHTVKSHWGVIPFLIRKGHLYDILHVQTASLLTFAVLTKPFHRCKVVYTRRLDFVPKGILTKWKYLQADLIIAISTPIKTILQNFGVKKMAVIGECIEEKQLNKTRAKELLLQLGIEGKRIIGTTAALVQHKDPKTLVKTIEALTKMRSDFVLLHFGDGHLKAEIEHMIAERKLESVYKLMGFHQNVEDFFGIMDVYVMSSEEEGLGSSVLDAFIYGVPVVSTNAGGLAEIVLQRGILVNVKDHLALACGIDMALEKRVETLVLAQKAQQFAQTELNLSRIHEQYLQTFKELLSL
jgi:glycosyltransferase involved in cell wall biosynthesis